MLRRLYVDNYSCLVNFEYRPPAIQLIHGRNGSGKTTACHALNSIWDFACDGGSTQSLFPTSTLTRWQSRTEQTFELEVGSDAGDYLYRLVIDHQPDRERSRIKLEELRLGQKVLFSFKDGEVQLFRDSGSEFSRFPLNREHSALALVGARNDNRRLGDFKALLRSFRRIQINPWNIRFETDQEDELPQTDLSNLVAWYRHLQQEQPAEIETLRKDLAEVFDGFETISLERVGERSRSLRILVSEGNGKPNRFSLDELSEGQRCLIALYTVLRTLAASGAVLMIDEPDNFLALAEIQPWLLAMVDTVTRSNGQLIIISHHPELIDYFAPDQIVLFERDSGGPTRLKPFPDASETGLRASELVARGWESE